MKKILKKNQVIIYIIALMLMTAGYLNYTTNVDSKSVETSIQMDSSDDMQIADIGDATLVNSNDVVSETNENQVSNNEITDNTNNENTTNANNSNTINQENNNTTSEIEDKEISEGSCDALPLERQDAPRDARYMGSCRLWNKREEDSGTGRWSCKDGMRGSAPQRWLVRCKEQRQDKPRRLACEHHQIPVRAQ